MTGTSRKPRARELGIAFEGETGADNAITDVREVEVGYATILEGEGPLVQGRGPIRTGVTAILPRGRKRPMRPVWAGFHSLNGNGEMTGTHWIRQAGYFYSPICITNTHGVGAAHEGVTRWMIDHYAEEYDRQHVWTLPVVAETYDGVLNDINGMHVRPEHARQAIEQATSGPVAEGNVGGGAGMIAYEFKGGSGTASQIVRLGGASYAVGVLVQANHGMRDWFTVLGVPVGRELVADRMLNREQGSIIVIIATDIPMLPHQLERVAQRASIGVGRGGTPGGNNSGDLFLAFSTANSITRDEFMSGPRQMTALPDEWFDPIYLAAVRAIEEAILNAMLAAEDMATLKPPGRICRAIDPAALTSILSRHGRMA